MSALDVRTAEWHADRRRGIGASDVPAIAGMSSYAKPIDIWQQKLGLVEPKEETALTRWGHLLEPVIADEFAAVTGKKVRRLSRAVRYHDWPILFAHLDRVVIGESAELECKSSMTSTGWGESGSDEVPPHVALQVQAQLAAADKETAYVAALIGYRDFRVYTIPRDRELFEDSILPLLREFWTLVETETPPEPDGSEAYGQFLRRTHRTDDGTERVATTEEQLLAMDLVAVRAARIAAEIREEEIVQRLQASMGDASRLEGPGWHATWRQSKDSTRTDWKLVAKSYRTALAAAVPDADLDVVESLYTETKPGARPFRFVPVTTEEE